jgi:hypothetical protein
MRQNTARTRDTLDAGSLPPTEGTELNHRTRITSEAQDRWLFRRHMAWIVSFLLITGFVIRLLWFLGGRGIAFIVIVVGLLLLYGTMRRFLEGRPYSINIKIFCYTSFCAVAYAAMPHTLGPRASYLFLFLPGVALTAVLAHVVTMQYCHFVAVNIRIKRRWVRYYRTYLKWVWSGRGPVRCPDAVAFELESYRLGFAGLALAGLLGFGALLFVERTRFGAYAGALGVVSFAVALGTIWMLWNDYGPGEPKNFPKVWAVSKRALVTFWCYNRHETAAAGVFQFPLRAVRPLHHRTWAIVIPLGVLTMAVLQVASFSPSNYYHSVAAKAKAYKAYDDQLSEQLAKDRATRPDRFGLNAAGNYVGRDYGPTPEKPVLKPHEEMYLKQLPENQRDAYLEKVKERRERERRASIPPGEKLTDYLPEYRGYVISTILCSLLCISGPYLLLRGILTFTGGRLLAAYYEALEADDAYEASKDTTPWDNRVARILYSRDQREREHFYLGRSLYQDYPVLLHRDLLHRHAHILGDTGSRKTAIGIAPLLTQLIAREDSSILIFDLKGDMALFECARREAEEAGVPFKWFTNQTGRSSYVFNPLTQAHMPLLTRNQKVQGILQALSLSYGEDYGRGFYSAMNEIVLSTYLKSYPGVQTFRELHQLLNQKNLYRGALDDWKQARHLTNLVDKLAGVQPLNVARGAPLPRGADAPDSEAIDEQIDMASLLRKRQVIYFYLSSAQEPTTVSPLAKLAMFALLTAASRREKGDDNQVYVFIDEFQRVISENLKLFLEQARSMKLAFILANQTAGQLESSGTDLTDTVDSCTAFKQSFKATDLKSLERLVKSSGEALYHKVSYKQGLNDGQDETSDQSFGINNIIFPWPYGRVVVNVDELTGPRLEPNTVIELSATPLASFVRFTEGSEYTQFSGYYTPIMTEFHISKEEFQEREKAAWPSLTAQTVLVTGDEDTPPVPGPLGSDPGSGPVITDDPVITDESPSEFSTSFEERLRQSEELMKRASAPGRSVSGGQGTTGTAGKKRKRRKRPPGSGPPSGSEPRPEDGAD